MDISACPEVLDPLKKIAKITAVPPNQLVLVKQISNADAYLASLHVRIDRTILERADRLRIIATPSTGLDHIDLDFAKARGIKVLSLKDDMEFLSGITATAELAWGLIISVLRSIPRSFDAVKGGDWARDRFRGHQLSGKTLGIIGFGRLGQMMAEIAKGFRMYVLANDVRRMRDITGVEMVNIDRLFRESDIISIHVHLNEETRGMIGELEFKKMKSNAVLINTSRGAIVDEKALLKALNEDSIMGAGLDVIEGEWRDDLEQHALIDYARRHQNLVITPHIGGVTYESQLLAYKRIINILIDYLRNLDLLGDSAV
jgi:D-3-phosphoglycerate dehydrogenase